MNGSGRLAIRVPQTFIDLDSAKPVRVRFPLSPQIPKMPNIFTKTSKAKNKHDFIVRSTKLSAGKPSSQELPHWETDSNGSPISEFTTLEKAVINKQILGRKSPLSNLHQLQKDNKLSLYEMLYIRQVM